MSSHRRLKIPVRTAITLTATGAVAATGVELSAPPGHAASVADVQAEVKALQAQAEVATNDYDAAVEQVAALQKQIDRIQGEAIAARQSLTALLDTLGPMAAAQYRSGALDSTLALMLTQNPDQYLQQELARNQFGQNEAVELRALMVQQAQLASLKTQAADRMAQLEQVENQAAAQKAQVLAKNKQARALLVTLSFGQQQQIAPTSVAWGVTAAQIAALPQVSGRVGIAIAFAKSKLGIYYQWGGTGNPGYDCSGLTQAAWAAAGVAIGRTIYDQVSYGYAVAPILSNLQPGDLIFYENNQHTAIYVGNVIMINAPTTGQQIQYAPWNMLPVDAVRRVV